MDRCPCCLGPLVETCPALVAPFITERALEAPARLCTLMTCPACGFRGFDHRFDETEMNRLYQGYRGDPYYQSRHRWEPWYTRKVNRSLGGDPGELRDRKANVRRMVTAALQGASPGRILDYGGDRGQFIPDEWEGERYVYDLSGSPTLRGVQAIKNSSDLEGASFDLVMLCMVLEHLPEPAAQLEALRALIGPGGVLFVEVPLERPDLHWAGSFPWGRRGLTWLAGHAWALKLVDLYSTFFRVRRGLIPRGGFLKAHEHINFFTIESLGILLLRVGFQVLACEELRFPGAYGESAALGCVARRCPARL